MLRYIGQRILLMIPTLLGVAILVFVMLRVMGGDPVETMLRGGGANVSQEVIEQERVRLGLDRPLYVQFGKWLGGMVTGDFGVSVLTDPRRSPARRSAAAPGGPT